MSTELAAGPAPMPTQQLPIVIYVDDLASQLDWDIPFSGVSARLAAAAAAPAPGAISTGAAEQAQGPVVPSGQDRGDYVIAAVDPEKGTLSIVPSPVDFAAAAVAAAATIPGPPSKEELQKIKVTLEEKEIQAEAAVVAAETAGADASSITRRKETLGKIKELIRSVDSLLSTP